MAYDQDSLNTTLIYDIISGNDRNLFWISPNNGVIYLMREIDLEEETLPGNAFVLQIEARQNDSPIKRAIARVEIEIIDLNDNRPEFEVEFYNISIVENLPSGFSVLQVIAIDRDQGENADFLYIISEETPNGAFLIDPRTGWITVRDQELLDREVRTKISITIQAIEKVEVYGDRNQKPSTVHIEITLLDANDNTPQFDMGNLYEFKINQNAPVGHIVGYITGWCSLHFANIFFSFLLWRVLHNIFRFQSLNRQLLIRMKDEMEWFYMSSNSRKAAARYRFGWTRKREHCLYRAHWKRAEWLFSLKPATK